VLRHEAVPAHRFVFAKSVQHCPPASFLCLNCVPTELGVGTLSQSHRNW
jgi:hypothetical protein